MSNLRTPQDYQLAIDKVYDRLGKMRARPKDPVNVKTENFLVNTLPKVVSFGAFGVGAASMAASLVFAVSTDNGIEGANQAALASFMAAISLVVSGATVIETGKQRLEKVLTPILGLVGKALPVKESHAQNMVNWSHDYPRITPVLGRWAAEHPSNILTMMDYNRMAKAVKRLRLLTTRQQQALQQSQSQQCIQNSAIGSSARKYRLTRVSDQFRTSDESDNPAPATPKM